MLYSLKTRQAVRFSLKTHEIYQKQKRKGKDVPYITHPLVVGLILAKTGCEEDVVIAGILHDTIEDSIPQKKVTYEMLKERFGAVVADLVLSVTETDKENTWRERKRQALEHIEKFSYESVLVKSADVIANTSEIFEDVATRGEDVFSSFNASKEEFLRNYINVITALLKKYPDSPLAEDLSRTREELEKLL